MDEMIRKQHPTEVDLQKLQENYNAEDYESVILVGSELRKIFPESWLLTNIIASAMMKKGQHAAAKPLLEQAIQKNESFFDALINLAFCYLQEGNSRSADYFFRKALQIDPLSIIARRHIIQNALNQEDWPAALFYLKIGLKLQPNDQYIFLNLLSVLIEMQKFEHFDKEIQETDFWEILSSSDIISLAKSLIELNEASRTSALMQRYQSERGTDYVFYGIRGMLAFSFGEHELAEKHIKTALRHNHKNKDLNRYLAEVYLCQSRKFDALGIFKKISGSIDPGDHEVLYKQSAIQLSIGSIDDARASALASLKIYQGYMPSQLLLAECDILQDEISSAKRRATQIIKHQEAILAAKLLLGNCLHQAGELNAAKDVFQNFISQFPQDAEGHNRLSKVYKDLGEIDQAENVLLKALELKPDFTNAAYNLANLYMQSGQLNKGRDLLKQVIEADYECGTVNGVALNVYVNSMRFDNKNKIVQKIELIDKTQDERLDATSRAAVKVALSKVYEDVGEIEKSFAKLTEGNTLKKSTFCHQIENSQQVRDAVLSLYDSSKLEAPFFNCGKYPKKPIFIVGMPRSGTTLLENILGRHSQITALGELDSLRHVMKKLTLQPTSIQFDDLRDYYGQFGREIMEKLPDFETRWFTEKTPENYRYLGLIKNAIPDAKFLYCFRSAEAVCWSIFKQYFTANGLSYSFDLDEIVERYNSHSRMMDAWHSRLGDDIIVNDYQLLTENPEKHLRWLMEKLNLTWENSLLNHSVAKSKSLANTASFSQVRGGIYKGSAESWKKFEDHLKPYFNKLVGPEFINDQRP